MEPQTPQDQSPSDGHQGDQNLPPSSSDEQQLPAPETPPPSIEEQMPESFEPPAGQPQAQELKIVIVEDNAPLADIYKTRLELIGYKCFAAYDGSEALEIIEREMPDLVLLDMMVPKVAGDEILRRMRASQWGKDIRVFVISNLNEVDAPKGLRNLGIEGYVVKANLSNDQLDQLVDKILKPKGQTESTSLETPVIATE
jgi:two-component system, response regulator